MDKGVLRGDGLRWPGVVLEDALEDLGWTGCLRRQSE